MRAWTLDEDDEEQMDTWTVLKGGVANWLQGRKRSGAGVERNSSNVSANKTKEV